MVFKEFLNAAGSGEEIKLGFTYEKGWQFFGKTIDFMYEDSMQMYHGQTVIQINADSEGHFGVILEGNR